MEIRNVTQFTRYIADHNLQGLHMHFQEIILCMKNFEAQCNCHHSSDKRRIYDHCNVMYGDSVKNVVPKYKNEFLAATPDRTLSFFSENGTLIATMCR